MRDNIPILLVEDDQVDVMTVQRAFKRNNIINPLNVVGNGREALDYLRHQGAFADQSAFPTPGIILMDINMPLMNGIECLKEIKADEHLRKLPVIMLTTSKEECDRVESFKLSVAGYIIKPVEFEKFVEAVKFLNLYWTLSELP
jgi:CheY-like chemotaxis protein